VWYVLKKRLTQHRDITALVIAVLATAIVMAGIFLPRFLRTLDRAARFEKREAFHEICREVESQLALLQMDSHGATARAEPPDLKALEDRIQTAMREAGEAPEGYFLIARLCEERGDAEGAKAARARGLVLRQP
jgi:hypothetical protein